MRWMAINPSGAMVEIYRYKTNKIQSMAADDFAPNFDTPFVAMFYTAKDKHALVFRGNDTNYLRHPQW